MNWVVLALMSAAAWAQAPSAFDVVSVKATGPIQIRFTPGQAPPPLPLMQPFQYTPGRVTCNMPLRAIVAETFFGRPWQFSSEVWLDELERFQIDATMPGDTDRAQARLMLQTMLAERFGLQFHRSMKNASVYALVAGKNGPKLHEAAPDPVPHDYGLEFGAFHDSAISVSHFAEVLARAADRPVVDMTGIQGLYNIDLKWKPNEITGGTMPDNGIFHALKQVGLRLVRRTVSYDTVIIDRIETIPTAN